MLRMLWRQTAIKYLGVLLPKEITTIKKINNDPIVNKINPDILRGNSNPFMSLTQSIESIKMIILSRILFLFQGHPVEISKKNSTTGIKFGDKKVRLCGVLKFLSPLHPVF